MKYYEIPFVSRKDFPSNIVGKLINIPVADIFVLKHTLKFKPDILLGFSGTHISHVGKILKKPAIVFDDTDHADLAHASYAPFADVIVTPKCFNKNFGKKHIRFNGYMELCYLHPNYFKPNPSILHGPMNHIFEGSGFRMVFPEAPECIPGIKRLAQPPAQFFERNQKIHISSQSRANYKLKYYKSLRL